MTDDFDMRLQFTAVKATQKEKKPGQFILQFKGYLSNILFLKVLTMVDPVTKALLQIALALAAGNAIKKKKPLRAHLHFV